MALMRDYSKAQLAFQVDGGDVDRFQVMRYRGSEGLSRLYRFEIELASADEAFAFDDIVGKPAVLSIYAPGGARYFHGVVSRFELTGETADQLYFRAELVPSIWMLTHRYNSRIFQGQTTKEIINDVLTKAGVPTDRVDLEGISAPQSREYCVQYRETDFNFICRLMEEEGIWWYFEQTLEGHTFVASDATEYAAIEGEGALPYQPPSGMNVQGDHVFRFRLGQAVRPGAVVLRDFSFENPSLNLETKGDSGRDPGLEFSDYPGEYSEQQLGQTLATVRAEEFECSRIVGVGASNCYRLSPGKTFELSEHKAASFNGRYLVTSVTHQGRQSVTRTASGQSGRAPWLSADAHQALLRARQNADQGVRGIAEAVLQLSARDSGGDVTAHRALTTWLYHAGQVCRDVASTAIASGGDPLEALSIANLIEDAARGVAPGPESPIYECRFECIPSTAHYRPPRITPWPVMRGTQTARVVGPSGEEIHTDEYGRVKAQFNWDREGEFNENSSCWIRVSQGFAGGQYGMMFLPRVGQEVIVDFLEGDPDKPIIVGRVFNADHMPPYKLPDEKTKSVIKTRSSQGGGGTNEIRFEDLKDSEQLLLYAQRDFHLHTNNDRVETVGHDYHLTVAEKQFELIKKDRHCEVTLDVNEKIGGKKSLEVAGDVGEKVSGNRSDEICGNYYMKCAGSVVIEAASALTLKVGGNFVHIDSSGVAVMGTKINLNSGGSAGSGSAVSLNEPEEPVCADTVEPGQDVTYSGGGQLVTSEVGADIEGYKFEDEEVEEQTSWIEIQLVDELGGPVPGEQYLVKTPDGKEVRGALNKEGLAHVALSQPGTCQISFPNLDGETWIRDSGAPPPSSGGNVGKSPPPEGDGSSGGSASEDENAEDETEPAESPQESQNPAGVGPGDGGAAAQSSAPAPPSRKNPYRKG